MTSEVDQPSYTAGTVTVSPKTVYGYDANGNTTALTNGVGNTTTTSYTADNLVQDSIDGAGDDTRYAYDANGNPTQVSSPSAVAHDATNPTGAPTVNSYTLDNLLSTVTEPPSTVVGVTMWRQTAYGYDPAGRTVAQQATRTSTSAPISALAGTTCLAGQPAPPSGTQCFTYDPDDRVASQTGRAANDTITATYDPTGNTLSSTDTEPTNTTPATLTAAYYLDNLPQTVDDGSQATSYSYDAAGNVAARMQAGDGVNGTGTVANTTQYSYDDTGRPLAAASTITSASSTPGSTGSWADTYDRARRVTAQGDPNGENATFVYNPDSTLVDKSTYPAGVSTTSGTPQASWAYTYNNDQQTASQSVDGTNTTSCDDESGNTTGPCMGTDSYTYDAANRLATFETNAGTRSVGYDDDSNRTTYGQAGGTYIAPSGQAATTSATYNADDSIATTTTSNAGTENFSYQADGDLQSDGCNTYSQDGFDRTTQIVDSGAATCGTASTVGYSYDALDRQRSHTDTVAGNTSPTMNIDYDGLTSAVSSEDPQPTGMNTAATNYTLDAAGNPTAVDPPGTGAQNLDTDGTDTIAMVTSTSGTVDCTARFDPYGNAQNQDGTDAQQTCNSGTTADDMFYNGARHDATSGTYQFGSRTYSPTQDAYTSPDQYRAAPSAANQSIGTDPLTRDSYSYVNGDPVNLVDLDGHHSCGWHPTCYAKKAVHFATGAVVDAWNFCTGSASGAVGCLATAATVVSNITPLGPEADAADAALIADDTGEAVVDAATADDVTATGGENLADAALDSGDNLADTTTSADLDAATTTPVVSQSAAIAQAEAADAQTLAADEAATAAQNAADNAQDEKMLAQVDEQAAAEAQLEDQEIASNAEANEAIEAAEFNDNLEQANLADTAAETEPALADDAAQSCSVNSFTAATPVLLANGTETPISKVAVGDKVLATDPQTGQTGSRPVTKLIVHSGEHSMVDVTLADGSTLTATDRHPFWDATTATFTYADALHPGDQLREANGSLLTITDIVIFDENVTAYNLTVNGIHTYYAGTTPVLVHNSCGPFPDGAHVSVDEALTGGEDWLGPNYTEQAPNSGRFVSEDGTRVFRRVSPISLVRMRADRM